MITLYSKTLPKETLTASLTPIPKNVPAGGSDSDFPFFGYDSSIPETPLSELHDGPPLKSTISAKYTAAGTVQIVVYFNKARVSFSGRNEIVKRKIQSKQDTFADYGTIKELWAKPDETITISGELFNDTDMFYPTETMNKLLILLRGGSSGEELYFSGTLPGDDAKRISGKEGEDIKVVVSSYSFGEPIAGYRQPFRITLLTDLANYDFLEE